MNKILFSAVGRFILQLWLTGIIFLIAIPGYVFYAFLWIFRLMQKKKIVLGLVVFLIILITTATISYSYFFRPFGSHNKEISFVITPGVSLKYVSDSLEQKHVIRSAKVMLVWLKCTGQDRKMQAGRVTFLQGDGTLSASEKLLQAVAIDSASVVRLAYDSSFISKFQINAKSLEGYLFPETYRFAKDVKAEEVLKKMVELFKASYTKIQFDPQVTSQYTVHEIVTLASIIEKEATLPVERARIAAVFHNRLKKGYPLGADPTVRFIFKKFNGPLRVSELNSDSPYNTRKFTGLPPGPICSPGLGAIQAAAAPLQTDELYFVAKWDGSGEHDFSRTNAEHDRKKMAIRQENQRRLRQKGNR
jgi:UPF0755 protein